MPRLPINLVGQKFERLLVVEQYPEMASWGSAQWICECDCGDHVIVASYSLRSGRTKSCGCLKIETAGQQRKTHGRTGSPTYLRWASMIQRCTNPNNKDYARYGGRGIKVCEEWKLFSNFLNDMGTAPEGLWLDRIDNNGNYEPSNCRWVTPTESTANRG